MDQLRVKTAMVAGTASNKRWNQVLAVKSGDSQVMILITVSYSGESDLIDLAQIGGSFLETLNEKT